MALRLQLGDIIRLVAPDQPDIANIPLIVEGIQREEIELRGAGGKTLNLGLREDGALRDAAIQRVELLSRATVSGYAAQHDLRVGAWIDVYFGGDLPMVITGQITEVDNCLLYTSPSPRDS